MGIDYSPEGLELLMRAGRTAEVRAALLKLVTKKIPRHYAAKYCGLARRVGLVNTALRIANPIVRPKTLGQAPPTREESEEYSAALVRIGAVSEAHQILDSVAAGKLFVGNAALYKAFAHISRWEYDLARPVLEGALKSERGSDTYFEMLLQINLAATWVYLGNWNQADESLKMTLESCRRLGFRTLEGNALELSAQSALMQDQISIARDHLKEAGKLLQDSPTLDGLFVRKWTVLTDLFEKPVTPTAIDSVRDLQRMALERKHWETIRDCDFHLSRRVRSEKIFHHLYFGTPFPSYKLRLLETFGNLASPPESYLWDPSGAIVTSSETPLSWINVASGVGSRQFRNFLEGRIPHRLLALLSSDFYRPQHIGTLFSALFPEEYFNPFSSPNRIHQAVKSLREFFQKNRIPLRINSLQSSYHLNSRSPFGILVTEDAKSSYRTLPTSEGLLLKKFKDRSQEEEFTAKAMASDLRVSLSQATRVLRRALQTGLVKKVGAGPSTRYRWP